MGRPRPNAFSLPEPRWGVRSDVEGGLDIEIRNLRNRVADRSQVQDPRVEG
jgi:hypothetical protein